ncbi:Fumagillin dodecapentaenoate synthase [Lachnellula cervina]|uniref:Fumagillin dodecapentaenoate synthase n=1 Tax=Lachnellula cervina TaxID=1316786 RepID=A0A7D8YQA6_9HELO|nr:Fumagillin dodecapentaenoate synthase [Lachnellula cervina]
MAISNFRNTLGPGDESSNVVSSSSSAIDRSDTTSECSSNNGLPDEPNSIAHRVQVPIAVVGMACRLPGHSNSPRDLWEFLERGGIAENEPPTSRFSLSAHHDKDRRPRTMKSPGGMFMEDVDPELFDAQFFSTSRVDATAMDPQQRQLLEVTYECLENGGIPMEKISGKKIGCLVGANAVDYEAIQARDPEDRPDSATIGVARSILSNRVSHFLNIRGPSMTIDTACSASLVALDVACRYLDTNQADGMIIAGANLWMNPEHNQETGMMRMTQSASGKCHTFDAKADGYVKAEGINAVYIKRLDDALRDGDPIRAVIRGTSTNSAGRTPGIASPSAEAQADAIRAAYANAGIKNFSETGYLECHGTATLVGDGVELDGAASVFAADRGEGQELIIGSIKSNIGHSEAAAGVSGLIKAILAVERGVIPGNPTFLEPNPKIDFNALRVRPTRTAIDWPAGLPVRRASVNSFGFGGANAHAVLEAADYSRHVSSYVEKIGSDFFSIDDEDTKVEGTPKVLVFSANDEQSLKDNVKSLSRHILNPAIFLDTADLAYTLSERRTRHYQRGFVVTKTSSFSGESVIYGKSQASTGVGFVFTGQGAQWSQMGLELIDTFPTAKRTIQHLDEVLQALPSPPSWTLLGELTEARKPEALRLPEFSQPLVTALQLALVAVLNEWDITPKSVVGHSSGEIAAAAAAGLITPEDAIKIAFFRGQAPSHFTRTFPLGMLAVGIGAEDVQKHIEPSKGEVQIACYNSPTSLTLSGPTSELEKVKDSLSSDGHFARMLLVDLAYHSTYMEDIGGKYYSMLLDHNIGVSPPSKGSKEAKANSVKMFSSVTGEVVTDTPDAAYWQKNMVSPVRFAQATTVLLNDTEAPNFLVEVGPANALAGPISQIKKSLTGAATDAKYASALKRGSEAIIPLFEVAGRLFLSGGSPNLQAVNSVNSAQRPAVIVDLPNYSWNHSTKYWHETTASKDWRFKKFILHDLLGSKMIGTPWNAPTFKRTLKIADLTWLQDHKLGAQIVFPGAGYIAMAIEAIYQTAFMTTWKEEVPARFRYRLRDVRFSRAIVIDADVEKRIMLTLTPVPGSTRSWYEFKVYSLTEESWTEHSTGLIRVETDYKDEVTPATAIQPLKYPTSGRTWYKAMAEAGYNFGASFQNHLMVESTTGKRESRSTVSLKIPPSSYGQSFYPMHPACIDGCFQTVSPPLWNGDRTDVGAVLVPSVLGSLIISGRTEQPDEAISVASAHWMGLGRTDAPRNYGTNCSVYDPKDGALILEMKDLKFAELETSEEEGPGHTFTQTSWDADISMLLSAQTPKLRQLLTQRTSSSQISNDTKLTKQENLVHELLDLAAHKNPILKIAELNLDAEDQSSLWLQRPSPKRAASSLYHFASSDSTTVVSAQEKYSPSAPNAGFTWFDLAKAEPIFGEVKFDVVLVKSHQSVSEEALNVAIDSIAASVQDGGLVLVAGSDNSFTQATLERIGKVHNMDDNLYICVVASPADSEEPAHPTTSLVSLSKEQASAELLQSLGKWHIKTGQPLSEIETNQTILVLDELSSSTMDRLDEKSWALLQELVQKETKILWVTTGAQLEVTEPTKAAINGFFRVLRAEEPLLNLMTLDVGQATGPATAAAIDACLELINKPKPKQQVDSEFVERDGILYISRLIPEENLTQYQNDDLSSLKTEVVDLHASQTPIRLRTERLGNIDSIHYGEISPVPLVLGRGCLEVELFAAGMNYKDVVVSMGIVPGNEHTLGGEGAGIVTRVSPEIDNFKVGQRVVVFDKGTFANRVQTTPGRCYALPDDMSFEQASTLSAVYLTSIYGLFDLAKLSKGQTVLIHSAAGGVGIAAIQLCQYIGAELFVTVGTTEKRDFLKSTFGLADDHIFNSRNTDFASDISAATNGRGIDVVLNSLTGDMLDESFRLLADGGKMIEIGKKDILDRNSLAMEPFDRNISFMAVDMSHERAPDHLVQRLLARLFELIKNGHVKPIAPIHTFSFSDVPSAVRFLRAGKHIGKIVITDGLEPDIKVPVRRALKTMKFRDDACYLIVGGLKGLCASLAVYMAKNGAKHLAVISRSGHSDEKSQGVVKEIETLGCQIDLLSADVAIASDVEKAFHATTLPIAGIVQGAMVLRDRTFSSMDVSDYHGALACKLQGTWNLHNVAEKLGLKLEFFTMLSSISGVVGQKGQANYAAGNSFLDAFASYRHGLGRPACSVDLGVIEDVGYIAERDGMQAKLDTSIWTGINERLLRKILYFSILQQQEGTARAAPATQIITGIPVPQPADSGLIQDARFAPLFTNSGTANGGGDSKSSASKDVQAVLLLLRSKTADADTQLAATVDIVNKCFVRILRLPEPMDSGRPISVYGIDSLAAVEVRNWLRGELGALVTTLDIVNATSLLELCKKIVAKVVAS